MFVLFQSSDSPKVIEALGKYTYGCLKKRNTTKSFLIISNRFVVVDVHNTATPLSIMIYVKVVYHVQIKLYCTESKHTTHVNVTLVNDSVYMTKDAG